MKRLLLLPLLFISLTVFSQERFCKDSLQKHIETLASEEFDGRRSGTAGDTLAANYIRDYISGIDGFKLLFEDGFQRFKFCTTKGDTVRTCNVASVLEGSDPELKNEYIVIGAHYDHVGRFNVMGQPIDKICRGADDNASGVATIMEFARVLAADRANVKRSVIFVTFGAEEMGLVGSKFFAGNMPVDTLAVKYMFNVDMLGRYRDDLGMFYYGTDCKEITEATPNPDSLKFSSGQGFFSGGSDHAPFAKKGIKVYGIISGLHNDYHNPGDTPDKINYDGMIKGMNFLYSIMLPEINK